MDPDLPVRIGRKLKTGNASPRTPVGSVLTRIAARPGQHTQQFKRQAWNELVSNREDHRDAANNAVTLGRYREQAVSSRGLFEHGNVRQQARDTAGRTAKRSALASRNPFAAPSPDRAVGPSAVSPRTARAAPRPRRGHRHCREALRASRVSTDRAPATPWRSGRRKPVRLRKDYVETDRKSAEGLEFRDDFRHARSRPWPLAERGETGFVNIDDRDRPRLGLSWLYRLIGVENLEAQRFDGQRVP